MISGAEGRNAARARRKAGLPGGLGKRVRIAAAHSATGLCPGFVSCRLTTCTCG